MGDLRLDPLQAKLPQGEIAGTRDGGAVRRDFSAELELDADKAWTLPRPRAAT